MSQLKELLLTQTGYSAWATQRLLSACSPLTLEQLDSRHGASHASILGTFCHMHDGERVWLIRLGASGTWRLPMNPSAEQSFESLVQSWPAIWEGYRQWLESASDVDLTDEVSTLLPDATIHGPRWQIALHAVNHSTLHRGQIITMLRTVGIPPPNTDLTSYLTAAQRPRHQPEKDLS
jgi:uncharacterized damage-inducible protein DinB